jgi:hypothetical protein
MGAALIVCRQPEAAASPEQGEQLAVNNGDLMHLWRLVEEKDAGPSWIHMMDRTMPDFRYQAWRRDPPVCATPTRSCFLLLTISNFSLLFISENEC